MQPPHELGTPLELDPSYSTTRRLYAAPARPVAHSDLSKKEGGLRTNGYIKRDSDEKPLLSIITVVFNDAHNLEKTILSIVNQSYENVEYIIVDGGSTDQTLAVIKKHEHAIDYWVSQQDEGIYDAMNKGIDLASGTWVMFINAGDGMLYIDEHSLHGKKVARSCYYYSQETRKITRSPFTKFFLTRNTPCHQSIQYYREHLLKYDTSFGLQADFEQMTRVVGNRLFPEFSESVTYFNLPGASAQLRNESWMKRSAARLAIIHENLGLFYTAIAFLHSIRIWMTRVVAGKKQA